MNIRSLKSIPVTTSNISMFCIGQPELSAVSLWIPTVRRRLHGMSCFCRSQCYVMCNNMSYHIGSCYNETQINFVYYVITPEQGNCPKKAHLLIGPKWHTCLNPRNMLVTCLWVIHIAIVISSMLVSRIGFIMVWLGPLRRVRCTCKHKLHTWFLLSLSYCSYIIKVFHIYVIYVWFTYGIATQFNNEPAYTNEGH